MANYTPIASNQAQKPVGANPHDLLRIRTERSVNIESHLIAAANSLRWFLSHNAANYADALQRARRAESLHAPMSEIISLDGIAMALQSHLATMRLEQLGQEQCAKSSVPVTALSNPQDVDRRVGQMLSCSAWHQPALPAALTHGERHGIMIGEGVTGAEDLRTVWRIKTLSSTALKLRELPQLRYTVPPTDIIGTTIITDDAYQSGRVIADAVKRARHDKHFLPLRTSPKRSKPLHVRGAPDYIQDVARGIGYSSVDELRCYADVRETSTDDYQVAKANILQHQQWGDADTVVYRLQA